MMSKSVLLLLVAALVAAGPVQAQAGDNSEKSPDAKAEDTASGR